MKRSYEKLGALVPVIEDAYGNVIDGLHRLKVDPKWPRIRLGWVTDPAQAKLARVAINHCRRKVPAEEISEALAFLVGTLDLKPQEVADAFGMSKRWVYKHLPAEYKDKEMQALGARRAPTPVERRATQKDVLLDRLMKYYPMSLLDVVWQHKKAPAKRERLAYALVELLLEFAERQKALADLVTKAVDQV